MDNYKMLQPIFDRFARARWMSRSVVSDSSGDDAAAFRVLLTEHGIRRMDELAALARRIVPTLCDGSQPMPDKFGFLTWLRTAVLELLMQFSPAVRELIPPRLSESERQALRGLAILYARGGFPKNFARRC